MVADHYGLNKRIDAYSGNAVLVRRASDNAEQAIGFVDGAFDAAALTTFIASTTGYVKTLYDQKGSCNLTQATSSLQPQILLVDGIYKIRFTGGDFLSYESSLGSFTNIGVSIVWGAPLAYTSLTQFQGGVDLGADLSFICPYWTSSQAPYSRHGSSELVSWANWNSLKDRHHYFKYANGTATIYEFGAKVSNSASLTNPSLARLRLGKHAYADGTFDFVEMTIYSDLPNEADLGENVINEYTSLFEVGDLDLSIGDSNLSTVYSGLGTLWTRWPYRSIGQTDWFSLGQGSSTLEMWLTRLDDIGIYLNKIPYTGDARVVIALGTNDIALGATAETTLERAKLFAQGLKARAPGNIKVYISTILPRNAAAPFTSRKNTFNNEIQRDSSGDFDGIILTTLNLNLEDYTNQEFFNVDGVHLNASGQREFAACVEKALTSMPTTALDPEDVKHDVIYIYEGEERLGTYRGDDLWSDPGVENVLYDVDYLADGETVVGELEPQNYAPTSRDLYNNILRAIGAATLTDGEFDSIEVSVPGNNSETYDALVAVLDSREVVSSVRDRLTYYFQARGVEVTEPTAARSNVYIGSVLE